MAKFLLVGGTHYDTVNGKSVTYRSGDIVDGNQPLDTIFPGKFQRLTTVSADGSIVAYADGRPADADIQREQESTKRRRLDDTITKTLSQLQKMDDKSLVKAAAKYGVKVTEGEELVRELILEQVRESLLVGQTV